MFLCTQQDAPSLRCLHEGRFLYQNLEDAAKNQFCIESHLPAPPKWNIEVQEVPQANLHDSFCSPQVGFLSLSLNTTLKVSHTWTVCTSPE